jgi:hypothetical protein
MNRKALAIALGLMLLGAGAAQASRTDESDVQAPRGERPEEVQAPRGVAIGQ